MKSYKHVFGNNKQLKALSCSSDFLKVAVSGEQCISILSIDDENCKFHSVVSLNSDLTHSDIVWNQKNDTLATGATTGEVFTWDIGDGRIKQKASYKGHERSVSKLSFHPTKPNIFASGSKSDIKLFDIRKKQEILTFKKGDVRFIQFNPHKPDLLAASMEHGEIQLYNISNRTDRPVLDFTAHRQIVFALDWHPTDPDCIVTCSRDSDIKVWNLTLFENTPKYAADITPKYTFSGVRANRVKWRPGNKYHLANCSEIMDMNVYIWDVTRTYVPLTSFNEHEGCVSDLAWRKTTDSLLYLTKDLHQLWHVFLDESDSITMNPSGLVFSPLGDVFQATKVQRTLPPSVEHSAAVSSQLKIYTGCHLDAINATVTMECAKQYKLHGLSKAQLCKNNQKVAHKHNKQQVAMTWGILENLFDLCESRTQNMQTNDNRSSPTGRNSRMSSLDSHCSSTKEEDICDFQKNGDVVGWDRVVNNAMDLFQPWHDLDSFSDSEKNKAPSPGVSSDVRGLVGHFLSPPTGFEVLPLVVEAMHRYAMEGDVQTAVCMAIVLGEELGEEDVNTTTLDHWFLSYVDILQHLELWNEAVEVMLLSSRPERDLEVSFLQNHKTFSLKCGCDKDLEMNNSTCRNCKCRPFMCCLCHQPVRGMYAWCQVCAHGGHIDHMRTWLQDNKECPQCAHMCEYEDVY